MWYEVIRDIPAGTELLAVQKVPLQFREIFCKNGSPVDRGDRETGKRFYLFISAYMGAMGIFGV